MLTDDARYDALVTRDPRFDGVFFVGVSTTGVYCRPICPARTPGRTRCSFYPTPAQAEAAGYRACFRCRPELAPGNTRDGRPAAVDAIDVLVEVATRRINDGALNEASIDDLAAELGVSARHLRRATEARLGVSPVELAQTRRLALAKQLLQDTQLPITEVAFAAGFGSVRRFNAAFEERMGSAPSAIRRAHAATSTGGVRLRLDYRAPYAWTEMLSFLRARAIPGVEHVDDARYRRVVQIAGETGVIEVEPVETRHALWLTVSPSLVRVLMPLVARVRRLFDLDARPDVIASVLGRDRVLAAHVARTPGLRLPGAIEPFEAAVRALLGQQVSVAAATTFAGRFAAAFGARYAGDVALTVRFPTAHEVAQQTPAAIARIGLTTARAAAVHGLAVAVDRGVLRFDGGNLERFVASAVALPGVGPWTAHYLAMRGLHDPDAFPAADLGVLKALRGTAREAMTRADAWRPFRSYAVMHLWNNLGGSDAGQESDRNAHRRAAPVRARRRAGVDPAPRQRGGAARRRRA
ncbi:MAG: AlkA N-terminal domain-containing protein [Kofleriaceae bacterium]|nr:AlkA N-terminal domain-containing protein [Kofleriaceae bacterium]